MPEETKTLPTPPASQPPAKQENMLHNLLLNILLPVTVLSMCSREGNWYSLGPKWALIVAVSMPVGYFIYDYRRRKKINAFSIIGIVSVLFTGGLGLLNLNAHAFALKEAAVPLILAFVVWWTGRGEKPMVRLILMNSDIVDVKRVEGAIEVHNAKDGFDRLIRSSTWLVIVSFLVSAALNYMLSIYFLSGLMPGSPDYTEAIGRQMGWGFLVIAVPSLGIVVFAMFRLFKGLKQLTGLTLDEILLPR